HDWGGRIAMKANDRRGGHRRGSSSGQLFRASVIAAAPVVLAVLGMGGAAAQEADVFWDADGSASGNDAGTGTNLGGAGTWGAAANWWDGSSGTDQVWNDGTLDNAVFIGTAANVTLGAAHTAGSLDFRSNGFGIISNSVLTLAAPATVNVASGS